MKIFSFSLCSYTRNNFMSSHKARSKIDACYTYAGRYYKTVMIIVVIIMEILQVVEHNIEKLFVVVMMSSVCAVVPRWQFSIWDK